MKELPKNHMKIFLIELWKQIRNRSSLFLSNFYKSNLCFYQQQTGLLSEAPCISGIAPLGNDISIAIKCSILLPGN